LPKEEVDNYFVWRQRDAERNSVAMLAQSHFSHKMLHGKDRTNMLDMLMGKGINWNDIPTWQKRGWGVERTVVARSPADNTVVPFDPEDHDQIIRTSLDPDMEIPIFSQDRDYVKKHVNADLKASD
jgi:tRNA(His) 5'-end guanylyltransferase